MRRLRGRTARRRPARVRAQERRRHAPARRSRGTRRRGSRRGMGGDLGEGRVLEEQRLRRLAVASSRGGRRARSITTESKPALAAAAGRPRTSAGCRVGAANVSARWRATLPRRHAGSAGAMRGDGDRRGDGAANGRGRRQRRRAPRGCARDVALHPARVAGVRLAQAVLERGDAVGGLQRHDAEGAAQHRLLLVGQAHAAVLPVGPVDRQRAPGALAGGGQRGALGGEVVGRRVAVRVVALADVAEHAGDRREQHEEVERLGARLEVEVAHAE